MMAENQSEATSMCLYNIQPLQIKQSASDGKGSVPKPRGGATLTQVKNGDIYLIGGANREAQCFGDVYRFDLATMQWTQLKPRGDAFSPRSGHSAVAIGDRIVVFGGMNPTECVVYEDVFVLDTVTQQWTTPLVEGWMPGARNAHAAIRLPPACDHDRILVYGGSSPEAGAFSDVYMLHIPIGDREAPLRWERCDCKGDDIPEARELHAASLLTSTSILFSGGRNKEGNVCTDMTVLELETWAWQLIPICEWNRCAHVAATINGRVVSLGGFDGRSIRDDCWAYADDEETWLRMTTDKEKKPSTQPEISEDREVIPERFGHCGCTVSLPSTSRSRSKQTEGLLIFGGMNAERDLNDLVLIKPATE